MLKGDGHSDENSSPQHKSISFSRCPPNIFKAMGYDMPSRRMSRDIRHEGIYYFKT